MITQQQREDIVLAAVNCEHQIDADCIRLYRDPTKAGSALSQMVDRVVAAIEQGAQPGADVVMVPRDPTFEMTKAAIPALNKPEPRIADIEMAYRAMIAAAPQPQQEQSK